MRIKSLEFRVKVVMEGFWRGLHRSPYHGFSVEFSEYRQYTQGDDPRHIDWKLLGRSDRVYVKRFEEETNLRCQLIVDQSGSMGYASEGLPTKAAYASTFAATLASFLLSQGDAVGLTTFAETTREVIPPRSRPRHLHRIMGLLESEPISRSTDFAPALHEIAGMLRRRGMVVLITDLLGPREALQEHLSLLAARRHEMVLLHIVDPAETDFPFEKATHFLDSETEERLYVDPTKTREAYQKNREAHLAAIRATCDENRITFVTLSTDRPLELAMFDFVAGRRVT